MTAESAVSLSKIKAVDIARKTKRALRVIPPQRSKSHEA